MDVKRRYSEAYWKTGLVLAVFIVGNLLLYSFTRKITLGLVFPFDWLVALALLIISVKIWKPRVESFNAKYPGCVEAFDYGTSKVYGKTVLLTITGDGLCMYYPKEDTEKLIKLTSIKSKEVKDFGILQGGNPGYKKLFIQTDKDQIVLSIKRKDIDHILNKL